MSPDPLRDPRFPNRPQSADYWRIVEVVNLQDGRHTEGGQDVPEIVEDIVDADAVTYMAMQRAQMVLRASGRASDPALVSMLGAIWMDAFTAGIRFQKAGGHRPE